jgi:hypothetical protein
VLPATWEVEVGGLWSVAGLGKSMRPYLKNKLKAKSLVLLAQVVAISSNPSTAPRPKKNPNKIKINKTLKKKKKKDTSGYLLSKNKSF